MSTYGKRSEESAELEFLETWPCGPCDFIIMIDGRSRQARALMAQMVEKLNRPVEEVWITYEGKSGLQRFGRSRRVPFASANREAGIVVFPCSRTRFNVKERKRYTSCGETSTHFGTYSGVALRPLSALPRVVSLEEKAKVLGLPTGAGEAQAGPNELHGMRNFPVFWQESKDTAFFAQLLEDFDLRGIVDLSPGSGALATASMLFKDMKYLGFCKNESHCSWLQNVLDRAVLPHVLEVNGPLCYQELAPKIQEYYGDVLKSLHSPDVVEESEEESDALS